MSILGLVHEESGQSLFIKYKAQARVWAEKDDEFDMAKCAIVCDMDSVKTGWVCWPEAGGAPEKVWAETLGQKIASPGKDFKMAFTCEFSLNGERKIWESAQTGALMGFDALYDAMSAARDGDKLAELKWEGAEPKTVGKGTTSIPKWSIVGWVERPLELAREEDMNSSAAASW